MAPKKTSKAGTPKKTIRKAVAEEKAAAKSEKNKLKAKAAEAPPSGESDEESEEAMMASVSSTSTSATLSAGAGGTAGTSTTESSSGVRSFRHHPEIENFYRFIYENDLRYEALAIIEEILHEKKARKALKLAKSKAH